MHIADKICVSSRLGATLAHQLEQQITWFIASGELKPGGRLPSLRQLAGRLGINMHTVRSAYQKLEANGLVEIRQGLGAIVRPYESGRLGRSDGAPPSHTVGVIVPSLENPFYHAFLQGVGAAAHRDRTLLFVSDSHDDGGEAERYFAQMSAKHVDGIIVASYGVSANLSAHDPGAPTVPVVTADWPDSVAPVVLLDLESAGYQATRHLVEHGHRRVGLITFCLEIANVRPVNAGYRRALDEAGIEREPDLTIGMPGFDIDHGAEGARRLLALPQPPTALFAIADMLAIGALGAIKAAGLRVPQDVALTSVNDIPLAALVDPPLTTVATSAREMGWEAMKMLQRLIGGKKLTQRRVILPTTLVIRQSCGHHESPPTPVA